MTAKDAYLRREWSRIYVEHGRLRPIPIMVVEFGEPIQMRKACMEIPRNPCDPEPVELDEYGREVLPCAECYGDGVVECNECDGTGKDICEHCNSYLGACLECSGIGEVECPECRGNTVKALVPRDKPLGPLFKENADVAQTLPPQA
jgi:hypothetical protein